MAFKILHSVDRYCHVGTFTTSSGKCLSTPMAWFGLSVIESPDFMFEAFTKAKIEAFISNAFDLLYQDKENERRNLITKFRDVGMYHKCDSGGFQLMKKLMQLIKSETKKKQVKNDSTEIKNHINLIDILKEEQDPISSIQNTLPRKRKATPLNEELVLKTQEEFNPDFSVILDMPLNPMLTKEEQTACVDWTIRNYKIALKRNNNSKISLLPVIHGYNGKMLDYAIKEIKKINNGPLEAVGIGSLVPMLKHMRGTREAGAKWNFLNLLLELREKLPDTFIHCFGAGGTTSYLAFLCGVDSVDSTGWIQKTAYGTIQLPGTSDRFLEKKSHERPFLVSNRLMRGKSINEIQLFMECQCAACEPYYIRNWTNKKDEKWLNKQTAFKENDQAAKLKRVIHNLSIFQSEILTMRKKIEEGTFEQFIKERLKRSSFMDSVDAIMEWKQGNKDAIKNRVREKFKKKNIATLNDFV